MEPQRQYQGAERRQSQQPYDGEDRRRSGMSEGMDEEQEHAAQRDARQRDDTH